MSERELERILQTEADEETVDKAVRDFLQSPVEVTRMASKYERQMRYDAKNTRMIRVKLNLNTDKDILAKIDSLDNIAGYIKELIRKDIGRGNKNV